MPRSGLPAARRSARHFQAVVRRVAHHVRQRVLDQLEHLAIEFGLGAMHFELDRLAELGRQVAHDPRQLLPGIADRLHARLHDAFLQLGGDVRQPLQRHLEFGILVPAHDVEDWLRVSTSSETIVIRYSSVSTWTRIDWLAILLHRPLLVVPRRPCFCARRIGGFRLCRSMPCFGAAGDSVRRSLGRRARARRAKLRPGAAAVCSAIIVPTSLAGAWLSFRAAATAPCRRCAIRSSSPIKSCRRPPARLRCAQARRALP